ncbi:hypothetical protein [Actinomycetospora sp. CA-084318]|uniref:hypothetical protein n=1 Tax=Actinomycetospora sp. CA-084318 TaxID=3239892 RepID=UPI003D972F10
MADQTMSEVATAATVEVLLAWENARDKSSQFYETDQMIAAALDAAWHGRPVIAVRPDPAGRRNKDAIEVLGLPPGHEPALEQHYALGQQQRRGAWYIPDNLSIKPWGAALPTHLSSTPRHALTLAHDISASLDASTTSAAAVWLWSTVEPTLELLLRPITIWAGERALLRGHDDAQTGWTTLIADLERLGLGLHEDAASFALSRWARTNRADQQQARLTYLAALRATDPVDVARRVRASRTQDLLAALAKKTKGKTQAPLARTALTKNLQPTLSAYFGGSWLDLLDYADLHPHPSEELITALPEPALLVNTNHVAVDHIAQAQNLAADDVEAILAAYLGTKPRQQSPIDERLDALKRWWADFDKIHAAQSPGMPELYGLIDDGLPLVTLHGPARPWARAYRAFLSAETISEVNRLWDGLTLPQWPENIVSEPHPHRLMADALGPAARFWHGVALTAWYETQNEYSRNTLDEVAEAFRADLAALDELGQGIDPTLFNDLRTAQAAFGEPRKVRGAMTTRTLGDGRTVEHWTGSWARRDGFERARDVITRHRRAWADTHLADYLAARWRQDLTQAVNSFHKHLAVKGKAPTFKQFSKMAASAANRWFNGDLSGIYRAMGESAPHTPRRVDELPVDALDFAVAVYVGLGGQFVDSSYESISHYGQDEYHRMWELSTLANKSVVYVQLREAMGETPEPKRIVKNDIWTAIWPGGLEEGWPIFTQYIDGLREADARDFPRAADLIESATPEDEALLDPTKPDGSNVVRVSFGGASSPRTGGHRTAPGTRTAPDLN